MRTRLVVLLAGVLALGACADADETSGDGAPTATGTGAEATDGAGTAAPPAASERELASADLPDGVAARVGDVEITTAQVQERVALVRELPEVQEQLQGEEREQAEAQLEGQVLGRLVLQRVVLQGAAEEGIEVGDERVAQDRSRLAEEAGGEEQFAEQLAQAGVPEEQLAEELRASIAFELVTEQLLAEEPTADPSEPTATATTTEGATAGDGEDGTEPTSPTPNATPDRTEQVQQNWLVELVADTDVVVDEQYGAWDPSTGQVVPD